MSEERSESLQEERRNCEKCGQVKKEVMLLTSSVFECVNALCPENEVNRVSRILRSAGTTGGNEYVEVKDGVDFQVISSLSLQEGETVKVCLSCGYAYGSKSAHFCGPTKAAPTVTATQAKQRLQSVAPLHLQAWKTLDEIYKEVGGFPFTVEWEYSGGRGLVRRQVVGIHTSYGKGYDYASFGWEEGHIPQAKLVSVP